MPNRIIRSDILDSERYHSVDLRARLAFFEILLCADDFGLLPVNPIFLRRHLTALDGVDKKIIDQILTALVDHDLIRIYESGGAQFAIIPRFRNVPRAKKSRWPLPPDNIGGNEIKELIKEMHSKRTARAEQMRANAEHVHAVYRLPITDLPITDYRLPVTEDLGSKEKKVHRSEEVLTNPTLKALPDAEKNSAPAPAKSKAKKTPLQESCSRTWEAYSNAYFARYGTEPVRNAQVNALVAQLCSRLPMDEAPAIAEFFVKHPGSYYVRAGHSLKALVADAEKIRTEWATNRVITSAAAQDSDRMGGMAQAVENIIRRRGLT